MKIRARIVFDEDERVFAIPCGTGDKNFKWLGIVASERYALSAPNGYLRRMDDVSAMSDKAQYHPVEIILPSGDEASPHDLIYENLHDGDEVVITLRSEQTLDAKTGAPSPTKWNTLAYTTSTHALRAMSVDSMGENDGEEDGEGYDDDNDQQGDGAAGFDIAKMKSKADFLRIVLGSQMLNMKKIEHIVRTEWGSVATLIPKLKSDESDAIEDIYVKHWDVFLELYNVYASTGFMNAENFRTFLDEAGVFPPFVATDQASSIYSRACKYTGKDDSSFSPSSVLLALLLCAQAKYNDTLDSKTPLRSSYEALANLFANNFRPLARRLNARSILKDEFCSDYNLVKLRGYYDELHLFFDKFAAKVRDVPSTLPVSLVADIFLQADLLESKETKDTVVRKLMHEVRYGTVFGREAEDEDGGEYKQDMVSETKRTTASATDASTVASGRSSGRELGWGGGDDGLSDDPLEEFSFAEFTEAACRAGYYKFYAKGIPGYKTSNTAPGATTSNTVTGGGGSSLEGSASRVALDENTVSESGMGVGGMGSRVKAIDSFMKGISAVLATQHAQSRPQSHGKKGAHGRKGGKRGNHH